MMKSQYDMTKSMVIDDTTYIIDDEGELHEVLQDKSSTGRIRPWAKHKTDSIELAGVYRHLGGDRYDRKADRLLLCGNYLEFNVHRDDKGAISDMKVVKTHSCRVRLCPLCGWRRSVKIQMHTAAIMRHIPSDHEYILLTLTVPNVAAQGLSGAIDNLLMGFNRLSKYKRFLGAVKGWYRGLEVTHNTNRKSKSFDTYHPHIHAILVVNKSYFNSRDYVSRDEWLSLWRKATGDTRITQVDVRKIKPKAGHDDVRGAVCEAVKYTVKSDDYLHWDMALAASAVAALDVALANRRLVAYGGIMKDLHARLNLDDEIDGDLTNLSGDDTAGDDKTETICYYFHVGYCQYLRC